ncbi:DNA-formamidopyrimidine glycosylase family protein [Luteipulveratus flavus]|uniref:DNA-(apurinic or apyrimidinic site) lyase n=1 Tax=Luteipulveratus flavus TaxID=3031728 RepID=A0ABT6C8S9_9MICO|nr:DNA-formamidopyrimidine glycosylase family protein [Luteipulveratus sp. YIM 133296]MDF8265295.1 DNA-formamidopyrimidine glycosylase family protein [Luteipulveratus sp. YIM 133296]
MPEGDAVLRTARRLHRGLAGRTLAVAELRWDLRRPAELTGRRTIEVVSRGKHLLHRIEGGLTLHTHLRMDGRWQVTERSRVSSRMAHATDLRALLATDTHAALGWRLGMLDLVPTGEEHSLVGHLGPDVLGADWDEGEALRRLRAAGEQPVGAALLDQRNLAGLGTIFTAEPLFVQRVNPWSPVSGLDDATLTGIVRRARRMIAGSVETSRPALTGDPREPTSVHGRSGRPCRRCGAPVRVAMIGTAPRDRTMFYCPRCQGGLAPTDDGRRQRPLGAR